METAVEEGLLIERDKQKLDVDSLSALALAYVGDSVFDLL